MIKHDKCAEFENKIIELEREVSRLRSTLETLDAHDEMLMKTVECLKAENTKLKREVEILRQYGNKDCTAMSDEIFKELDEK